MVKCTEQISALECLNKMWSNCCFNWNRFPFHFSCRVLLLSLLSCNRLIFFFQRVNSNRNGRVIDSFKSWRKEQTFTIAHLLQKKRKIFNSKSLSFKHVTYLNYISSKNKQTSSKNRRFFSLRKICHLHWHCRYYNLLRSLTIKHI